MSFNLKDKWRIIIFGLTALFAFLTLIFIYVYVDKPQIKRIEIVKDKREQLISIGVHPPDLDKCYEGNHNDAVCETKLIDGREAIVRVETDGNYRIFVFVKKD